MITDESVAQFISFTGAGPDEARSYLEMANGDVSQAAELFFDMGGSGGGGAGASPPLGPTAPPSAGARGPPAGGVDADLAAEFAAVAAAAGITDVPMGDADAPMEEVRAPIAEYQDQIISQGQSQAEQKRMQDAIAADSAAMNRRMSFDRPQDAAGAGAGTDGVGSGEAINQLFAAPAYNESGPFLQVIDKAANDGKWLLVNIQQAEVFASHALNRDVWSDETIKDTIEGSFLFWQRDDKSSEGDAFCQYYQCGHQLPHICIVDPRTKRRVKSWDGRKWVEKHSAAEYLFGFLDEYSMARSPPGGSPQQSPAMQAHAPPAVGGNVDSMELTGLDDVAPVAMEEEKIAEEPSEPVCTMPDEPADNVEHLKVSLRLLDGERVTRRFLPTDPVEQMFVVASAFSDKPASALDLCTQFPKRSMREVEGGLQATMKDAGVAGNMVMLSVRAA